MRAFDATCLECGEMHIVWVRSDEEEGDEIGHVHDNGPEGCPGYGRHRLEASLDGLSRHDKWGEDEQAA